MSVSIPCPLYISGLPVGVLAAHNGTNSIPPAKDAFKQVKKGLKRLFSRKKNRGQEDPDVENDAADVAVPGMLPYPLYYPVHYTPYPLDSMEPSSFFTLISQTITNLSRNWQPDPG